MYKKTKMETKTELKRESVYKLQSLSRFTFSHHNKNNNMTKNGNNYNNKETKTMGIIRSIIIARVLLALTALLVL